MASTARRTDPALWDKVKRRVMRADKGGAAAEWSARKAQLAVADYRKAGAGCPGAKKPDNSLSAWAREEVARSTAKKRADTRAGRQFSAQPRDAARKTASARKAASS